MTSVSINDIRAAAVRILKHVSRTQIQTSREVNRICGREVFLKCEHLQSTGSFKVRGALNNILQVMEDYSTSGRKLPGIITHSSGNHGQATAWAARQCELPCIVVTPENTPTVKCDAIRGYGAQLVFCGVEKPTDRDDRTREVIEQTGYSLIHSYDDTRTIAGQGTVGLELIEQAGHLDVVLVAVSGGGLAAGVSTAVKSLKPSTKVYLVEPKGKNLQVLLEAGKRIYSGPPAYVDTIAEGIRLQQVGNITFPLLLKHAEKKVYSVTNTEMIEAMRFSFTRLKQVIEAAAAAPLSVVLNQSKSFPESVQRVGVILCGGNTDIDHLPWVVS